jgi:glycosyltransferase involved in cell wall biosynthesis
VFRGKKVCKCISAVIVVRNEESQITDCLNELNWLGEIVVVDTGSTDRTVELAKRITSHVYEKEFCGFGDAKNYGLRHATGSWIISLDADERIPAELREEIEEAVRMEDAKDGYYIPRKPFFLGRPIRHGGWFPGHVMRLFRRGKGACTFRKVHEEVLLTGEAGYLKNCILHHTDPNLYHYLIKLNHYTTLAAEELVENKASFRFFRLLCGPPFMFVKMYFIKLGFLDGMRGFLLAVLSACHVFVKYAKLWERKE